MLVADFGLVALASGSVDQRVSRDSRPSVGNGLLPDAGSFRYHPALLGQKMKLRLSQKGSLMRQLAEFVAVLSCGLFTGAAVYVTLVEHPGRMVSGLEIAVAEFSPSYRRGSVMQATCAALGLLSSIAAWLAGHTWVAGC